MIIPVAATAASSCGSSWIIILNQVRLGIVLVYFDGNRSVAQWPFVFDGWNHFVAYEIAIDFLRN
jgi:hypothetical protein